MGKQHKKAPSSACQAKVHKVMHEYKHGSLHSGSGGKVKSRDQAVAIAMSYCRSKKGRKAKL